MKSKSTSTRTTTNYESIYALIICVLTMLISLLAIGKIVADMIALLGMAQNASPNPGSKAMEQGYYSSLIGSGAFLVVSLFAFALHRPMLNNER